MTFPIKMSPKTLHEIGQETISRYKALLREIASLRHDGGLYEDEVKMLDTLEDYAHRAIDALTQMTSLEDPETLNEAILGFARLAITEIDTFEDNLPRLRQAG